MRAIDVFRRERDFLIDARSDYVRAYRDFTWPRPEQFNWAIDWFDAIARDNRRAALRIVSDVGPEQVLTFEELRAGSNRLANFLLASGLRRGDRVLLMLGNVAGLWQAMLAAIKLACPLIPTTTLMKGAELQDRLVRGEVRAIIAEPQLVERFDGVTAAPLRFLAHGRAPGWLSLQDSRSSAGEFEPERATRADELMLLYFTSGTTARPKLVAHTHASYPIGHLSTMYWLGLVPGDVHLNLSSPGWAKHAWSSFFAPWNAEATIVALQTLRFDAAQLLQELVRCEVTSFCAPPTVWRALIRQPLARYAVKLREALSAGEPLNPEVIKQVQDTWGLTIRDGYGQTETTLQIGNFPGQPVTAGSMGLPAPGYRINLLDPAGEVSDEGEIALPVKDAPIGLMRGYLDDPERTAQALRLGHYRTGDIARRDSTGRLTYVGRNDDVFKSSGYRISPFELESVLIEHGLVVEAAVVPSPDSARQFVPKAFIVLAGIHADERAAALAIFRFVREKIAPFKRIRRLEFRDLPKTVSGKIRRVELRGEELQRTSLQRREREFWEEDFPQLQSSR